MANYVEEFNKSLDWQMPFARTGKFPLDRTDIWGSYEDACKYAKGDDNDPDSRGLQGTSYIGQCLTVYENDTVTVYKILPDRTLEVVGKPYTLPQATADTLGGVKLGHGLEMDESGHVNVTGSGTADAVEWKNVLNKPDLLLGNLFTHSATTVATLKQAVAEAVTAETLALNGIYQSSLTVGENTYRVTIIVNSAEMPIIFLYKGADAWITTAVKDVNGSYTEDIALLTTKALTVDDLTALHAVIDENYVHTDNNFTAALLEKLNNIAAGAQKNVQADWSETDEASDAFIKNKPTKLSDFTNDKNFIDSTVENLVNYYKKTEVNELIAKITTIDIEVVDALPTENISSTTIYLVPKAKATTDNVYEEYIYIKSTSKWEIIGDTVIDLSNYLQKDGDASNVTVTFTQAAERALPESGASLAIIIGTIIKYLADLSTVAFTGSYKDLKDKPEITVIHQISQTIAAGQTSTSFTDVTNVISVLAKDATTNENVIVDWKVEDGSVVCSISKPYVNDISVSTFYVVE